MIDNPLVVSRDDYDFWQADRAELRKQNTDLQASLEAALTENDALKASNKVIQEHYAALFAEKEAAERARDKLKQELEENYRADAQIQEQIGKLMAERDAALKAVKVLHALLEQLQWQYFPMDDRADCPRCGCHEHVGHSQDCEIKIALSGDPAPDLVLVPKEGSGSISIVRLIGLAIAALCVLAISTQLGKSVSRQAILVHNFGFVRLSKDVIIRDKSTHERLFYPIPLDFGQLDFKIHETGFLPDWKHFVQDNFVFTPVLIPEIRRKLINVLGVMAGAYAHLEVGRTSPTIQDTQVPRLPILSFEKFHIHMGAFCIRERFGLRTNRTEHHSGYNSVDGSRSGHDSIRRKPTPKCREPRPDDVRHGLLLGAAAFLCGYVLVYLGASYFVPRWCGHGNTDTRRLVLSIAVSLIGMVLISLPFWGVFLGSQSKFFCK